MANIHMVILVYRYFKETLEVVALVAACFAFITYLAGGNARERSDQLQTLQLSQLCQSLAYTVDGTQVWNYQEPQSFDDWDIENEKLDKRISFLNASCSGVPNFVPPTRMLKGVTQPKKVYRGKAIIKDDTLMLSREPENSK